jgi:adenylate cyclase
VKKRTLPLLSLALIFLICGLWVILSQIPFNYFKKKDNFLGPDGATAFLEQKTIDARFDFRGPIEAPVKVCYVDVDTYAISKLGNFPWNREYFALALTALFDHGQIRAAGMDFVFSNAGLPDVGRDEMEVGSARLGKCIYKYKNVVLATTYGTTNRPFGLDTTFPLLFDKKSPDHQVGPPELPAYSVLGPNGHVGLIDTIGNDVRFVPFFAKATIPAHTYLPMSLKLALLYLGLEETAVDIKNDVISIRKPDDSIAASLPLFLNQLAEPNWFTAWEGKGDFHASIFNVIAYGQMLGDGTEEQKVVAKKFFEQFRDSVVLIGPVDPLLKDLSPMPLSGSGPVPRVSIHGNLLKTILSGKSIHRPPVWLNIAIIFALGFVASSFSFLPANYSSYSKVTGAVTVSSYILGAFWIFSTQDVILPLVAPVGAALTCAFTGALLDLTRMKQQKRRLQGMFGTYLSPNLVNKMIESGEEPTLGGIDAEITAFFSDVQGFSAFSEILTPQQLVGLMNEYLSGMTDILMESGCYVDKYIGDAIVGIFNAPVHLDKHALQACIVTQLLHKRLAELRSKWASEGNKWPPIVSRMQMRIGMNTGFATVGNMGSSRRFSYTMMGDTVNLAARCESGSKSYGAYTMITGETMRAASKEGDACVFRFLDNIIVKGRKEPAEMYEVVCLRSDLTEEISRCLDVYAQGIQHYLAQRWDEATTAFQESAKMEPNRPEKNPDSPSTPSLVMLERTLSLKVNPPGADWDGVFKMQSK